VFLQIAFDVVSLIFSYLVAFVLIEENTSSHHVLNLGIVFGLSSLLIGRFSGIYKTVIKASGIHLLKLIVLTQAISVGVLLFASTQLSINFPVSFFVLLFLLSVFISGGGRVFARQLSYLGRPSGQRLLIYGAGLTGMQLLTSLRQDLNYEAVAFIDDQSYLQQKKINGLKVISSSGLKEVVDKERIEIIALAMPGASRQKIQKVVGKLEHLNVCVKTVPKVGDILGSKSSFGALEEIDIVQLLGREAVPANEELLAANISDKVVLVTGAGGSIGSELCRQIINRSPTRLILVDHSELALYKIQEELGSDWGDLIRPILGSVCDQQLMQTVMEDENVESVFHAAAYKHVPLVEANPFAAIHNNVFGTQKLLEAAKITGVSSFTLVSTDKAVRPTNVMGASKRLAEILCQLASADESCLMTIAMVRFGNVLGSSGSVIPKFRDQINAGGPVTVTHKEITRYFMVIPEAVQLVLQASAMATKGEVFVLDMGTPIRIADLAEKLVKLSGNIVNRGDEESSGKISSAFTGLRPGEKLYEELLISGEVHDTQHEKIKKISENYPEQLKFNSFLRELHAVCASENEVALRELLSVGEIGYTFKKEGACMDSDDLKNSASDSTQVEVTSYNAGHSAQGSIDEMGEIIFAGNQSQSLKSGKETPFRATIFRKLLHKYFLVSRPLTVGVRCVILTEAKEVLLIRHTYISGWHLPGGGVDVGESAEDSIAREVLEETGLVLKDKPKLVGVFHSKEISNRDHVVLYVSKIMKKISLEVSTLEIESSKFFSLKNLPIDLDPSSELWIEKALVCDNANAAASKPIG
jgi:FlaA1/EpsC-like NDP-sugar epimerase/8-oxo-dGTP pyrophosphatase MutT (NUDIX family)